MQAADEKMEMSHASLLPLSSLLAMQDQGRILKTQRSEQEWLGIFDQVLHAGEVEQGSGVFQKVESSGKVCSFSFFSSFFTDPSATAFIFLFLSWRMC